MQTVVVVVVVCEGDTLNVSGYTEGGGCCGGVNHPMRENRDKR